MRSLYESILDNDFDIPADSRAQAYIDELNNWKNLIDEFWKEWVKCIKKVNAKQTSIDQKTIHHSHVNNRNFIRHDWYGICDIEKHDELGELWCKLIKKLYKKHFDKNAILLKDDDYSYVWKNDDNKRINLGFASFDDGINIYVKMKQFIS